MKPVISRNVFVLALALVFAGGSAASAKPGAGLADGLSVPAQSQARDTALPAGLRSALYRALAENVDAHQAFAADGCAHLPGGGLKACFDRDGVHFSGAGASPMALRLIAYGRGSELTAVAPVAPVFGTRHMVSYTHGDLSEWWQVLPMGFEQGFMLAKRPAGQAELRLVLAASGAGERRSGGVSWGRLHYGKLAVNDANGEPVPAMLRSQGGRIMIAVNDVHATYPLTVDPLVWIEQKATVNEGVRSDFGYAVDIKDGTAFIGVFPAEKGAVYVFSDHNGNWVQTQKLTASDGVPGDYFGYSIASDGKFLLIGAQRATVHGNARQGAVYVFTKSKDSWTQTQKLVASDGKPSDGLGFSLAIDGSHALTGARAAVVSGNIAQGAAYVLALSDDAKTWSISQKLTADDGAKGDYFGTSVALSGDTALVGALTAGINDNPEQGAAYLFVDSKEGWSQAQKLTANDGAADDNFGAAVAIDGKIALVGADRAAINGNAVQGAVYEFSKLNGVWSQTQKITASDGTAKQAFGISIALAGATALIGAPTTGITRVLLGKAYVFQKNNGTWTQLKEFLPNGRTPTDWFGYSVALDGANFLIGAPHANINGNELQGSAYFYGQGDLDLDLSVPESVDRGEVYVSQTIATNNASAISPGVAVTMTVPAGASFVSANATQGTCAEASSIVKCDFGKISGNAGVARANVSFVAKGRVGETMETTASVKAATPALTASAPVTISGNNRPVARNGVLETKENTAANSILSATDPDGDALHFSISEPPAHGEVEITDATTGAYVYTPAQDHSGQDSFNFVANDGMSDSNVATISITVSRVNNAPTASDGTLVTDEDTAADGVLKATDPDGDALTFSIVSQPEHGSVTLDAPAAGTYTYTPSDGYSGADSFTFKANDGRSDSNVATIAVTVNGSTPPPPDNDSGGGSFGGLLLMLLAVLAAATAWARNVGRKQIAVPKRLIRFGMGHAGRHEARSDVAGMRRPIAGNALRAYPGLRGLIHANGQTGRREYKRKETGMRMYGKWTTVAAGILALAIIVGLPFAPSSSAAGHAAVTQPHKSSGLTERGIEVVNEAGLPSSLVTMAPQSSLKLLSRATDLGPHASDSTIGITVALKLRNVVKLKRFLEQVQNPHSTVYRQWLTPAEFTRLYAPTKADVARVTSFLKARGIAVKDVSSNRMLIHTTATTEIYEHALGIRINNYKLNGRSFYSTTDSPKLPRTIAPLIVNVLGLNHGVRLHSHVYERPLVAAHGLSPRLAPPASLTNLNPLQIAHAYNYPDIADSSNAAGVDVAILTAMSSGLADLSAPHDFWSAFGLPDHTINVIPVDGDNGAINGMGETLLDVEYSGAMGPGITQNVYVAADAYLATFLDMYNQFANDTNSDGTARNQVMSTSWGAPEITWGNGAVSADQIFMQATAEGISMFAAAGDHGSGDNTSQNNVSDYPSSSLYITAANGTQLNISDLAGDYGSEVVWNDANCFGNGRWATGGAVSRLFDKPGWQTGPGVPDDIAMRMNSDMAATASCSKPMLIVQGGRWLLTAGTSAVAPQLAGMFAIAVAENGESLGQSNQLIYGDANNHYSSDFHDVTEGNNGAFEAGPNWDHPTGWGSPNVGNLLAHIGIQGPKGTLKGAVTAAATGSAIAGVRVAAVAGDGSEYGTTSGADGTYLRVLPAGSFTVTVSHYGYEPVTTSLKITDGNVTTKNFTLHTAAQAVLSGKVSDGSGHGYGLYANIRISAEGVGQVADLWTNPETGTYHVKLPEGTNYTLDVQAALNGYNPDSASLTLSDDTTQNIALAVNTVCTAPGYAFATSGFGQDFNGSFPPAGWSVVNGNSEKGVSWKLNSDWGDDNITGGSGTAADADSNMAGSNSGPYDTSLVTPDIAVAGLPSRTILRYKANYINLNDALDLDISADDGGHWTNISHWTKDHGALRQLPGYDAQVELSPYLPSSGSFRLRWRFYSDPGGDGWNWYAMIDDVVIGSCQPIPGGLITGQVFDANTGEGIVGAEVSDDLGENVHSMENPADPDLLPGFYQLFASAGQRSLTAVAHDYSPASTEISVTNGGTIHQDFKLQVPELEVSPSKLVVHVMAGHSATVSLALKSTGEGDAVFTILPIDAPVLPSTISASGRGVPLRTVKGYFTPASMMYLQAHGKSEGGSGTGFSRESLSNDSPWQDVPDLPAALIYNSGAMFPTGIVYSVGGYNGAIDIDAIYAYNPQTNSWHEAADMAMTRSAAAAVVINARLYIADGWALSGAPIATLGIFDPSTGKITQGADNPVPAAGGAAAAIMDGKLYLVGGCNDGDCAAPLSAVQVYDPVTDGWSSAPDYPHGVAFLSCGGINGKLYCAGGTGLRDYGDAYVYDPGDPDAGWTPVADLPVTGGLWGAGYTASKGMLLVSGGVTVNSSTITNAGYAYDPANNSWSPLPNANDAVFRGASACGFYRMGGTGEDGSVASAEVLPGFAPCGNRPTIPWLTPAPLSGTVAAGAQRIVTLTFDGSGQKPFTISKAYLGIRYNAPQGLLTVPVKVVWQSQHVALTVHGKASPNPVAKGADIAYALTVENQSVDAGGPATETTLTYILPEGASYVGSDGDASCTAPSPDTASSAQGTVVCDYGTIDPGASKTGIITVRASNAGTLVSHFFVSAREPNDAKGTLDISSTVLGTSDLAVDAPGDISITKGDTGTVNMMVKNLGPDVASDVQFKVYVSGDVDLQGVTSDQGSCALDAGGEAYSCDLGDIELGSQVKIAVTASGAKAGTGTVSGQAVTASNDTNPDNSEAVVAVTVNAGANDHGGGGALEWLVLVALLGLAFSRVAVRRNSRRL